MELPSPIEIIEQRALRKAKKVALFLAYNGKGYLVRHRCCFMHGDVLLLLLLGVRQTSLACKPRRGNPSSLSAWRLHSTTVEPMQRPKHWPGVVVHMCMQWQGL